MESLFFRLKRNQIYHDIIESLVTALEAKDEYTSGHSDRVAYLSQEISKKLGIKGSKLETIHMASHLHDIGKIGVPDKVLNKTDKLSQDEWEYIKKHPTTGYEILSKSKQLKSISKIVLHHHERWDGAGYPHGLKGEEIPLGSRIIAISDTIDAMMSDRPYRKAMSFEACMKEIIINSEKMYDPSLTEFIENNLEFMRDITKKLPN